MKWPLGALLALAISGGTGRFDCIRADNLRGRVSFLASDLLRGRDTPSPGLEAAAGYIAEEFHRAGIESPPGLNYFQRARFDQVTDRGESFQFVCAAQSKPSRFVSVAPEHVSFLTFQTIHLANEPVFKWTPRTKVEGSLAGKVVMLEMPGERATVTKLELAHPDAIALIVRAAAGDGWRSDLLVADEMVRRNGPAILSVPAADVKNWFEQLPAGSTAATITINAVAPILREIELKNVVGVLPGSDSALARQVVLVTAHYDHLGVAESGSDRIYNGADDNASGVAAVIELAGALARVSPRPKRTLVFLCFFGEEKGLLGSQYYADHTLFPLGDTVADINFEQMGIPAPQSGLPEGTIGVTGYDLSDLPGLLADGIQANGARLARAKRNLEYFDRSDNYVFARAGVPAHTFLAAFEFPDYHQVSDEWRKLDYGNMARIVRGMAAGILDLANGTQPPRWSDVPEAQPYRAARRGTRS